MGVVQKWKDAPRVVQKSNFVLRIVVVMIVK